jgi:acid phosphatase family membrane protein YuiD
VLAKTSALTQLSYGRKFLTLLTSGVMPVSGSAAHCSALASGVALGPGHQSQIGGVRSDCERCSQKHPPSPS